ncbi:uncharacterized protein G2W53_038186 [Senna tora]|uniref:Uncharacterized protein n=1 Tax=Senna tora TaxID=362788 RepID=A0A834SNP2_9FABA|nr:uncharacterized protein G2W53_038186 [Senna tora]
MGHPSLLYDGGKETCKGKTEKEKQNDKGMQAFYAHRNGRK